MRRGLQRSILALAICLWLAGQGCSPAYEFKGSAMEPPLAIPDFELTASDGRPLRLSQIEEEIVLVYFGYTFCPDVCPLTLADARTALNELPPAERGRVRLLFISADPERDTPETLSRYLSAFDADFTGMTGDIEAIQAVMQPFGAYAEKAEVANSAAGYLVNHTARLYLLNAQREVVVTYPFGFETEALSSDVGHLLRKATE
jgi:protein SCO1/2